MELETKRPLTDVETRMHNALGVIIRTPHILAYLEQHDPMALLQAREAFLLADFVKNEYEENQKLVKAAFQGCKGKI